MWKFSCIATDILCEKMQSSFIFEIVWGKGIFENVVHGQIDCKWTIIIGLI